MVENFNMDKHTAILLESYQYARMLQLILVSTCMKMYLKQLFAKNMFRAKLIISIFILFTNKNRTFYKE